MRSIFACERCSFRLFCLLSGYKIFDNAAGGGGGGGGGGLVLIIHDRLVQFLLLV